MRFEVLGPLRVLSDGGAVDISRPALRRLLSILLLHEGRPSSVEALVREFWWDGAPATARNTLQAHVSGLRRSLGRETVLHSAAGYALRLGGHQFDLAEFSALFAEALEAFRGQSWTQAAHAADAALELWRGEPFSHLADDVLAIPTIVRLVQQKEQLLEVRIGTRLAVGRNEEALAELEGLVEQQPLNERLWEYLMLARHRLGRQAGALRAYQRVRRILGRELGIEPGTALRQLEEQILFQDEALGTAARPPAPHSLPAKTTSFVGRDTESERLKGLLQGERIVTVFGGPGFGKTRLAVETAWEVLEAFDGGAWFVPLGSSRSEKDFIGAVTRVMGIPQVIGEIEQLAEALASRPSLIVLDDCEHVLEAATRFARTVRHAAGPLKLLITSRSPLGMPGDASIRLGPLETQGGTDRAESDPSVVLFMDRASARDETFALTEVNAGAVIGLCRRLGRIPLAIELAASWVGTLGIPEIADLLDLEHGSVGGDESPAPREPLEAAIRLSYELLPESARLLFLRSACFAGAFALDDIRAVCVPDRSKLEVASDVVRVATSSLLETDRAADGSLLYHVLEPIRDFAERVGGGTEGFDEVRERHTRHITGLASAAAPGVARADPAALALMDRIMPDLRLAWERLLERQDAGAVAESAVGVAAYFHTRFAALEALEWLEAAKPGVTDPGLLCDLVLVDARLSYVSDLRSRAMAGLVEGLDLARAIGDASREARALALRGQVFTWLGRGEESSASLERAVALYESVGDGHGLGVARLWRGINHLNLGEIEQGIEDLTGAIGLLEDAGDRHRLATAHLMMSDGRYHAGDWSGALRHSEASRAHAVEAGLPMATARALVQSAVVEARWGDNGRAAGLLLDAFEMLPDSKWRIAIAGWAATAVFLRAGEPCSAVENLARCEVVYQRHGGGVWPTWTADLRAWRDEAEMLCTEHAEIVAGLDSLDEAVEEQTLRNKLGNLVSGSGSSRPAREASERRDIPTVPV